LRGDTAAPSVHDAAAYILARLGKLTTMKLQKLIYYSQAWHLAWDGEPLFPERVEAWAPGPTVRELYDLYRGQFSVEEWPAGDPGALDDAQRETVDAVIEAYGALNSYHLTHLIRAESPWRDAREGLQPTELSRREIPVEAMRDYYASVDASPDATLVGDLDWVGHA
jgi:uncharacterized phage-associated protein